MAKKRYRPRSGGNNNSGGGGQSGGRSKSNQNGGGNRSRRRRRNNDNRRGDRDPGQGNDDSPVEAGYGMLEMHPKGYGFLRSPKNNYSREPSDPFVPGTMIEKYNLREGLMIRGFVQIARKQQGPRLKEIVDVDGMPPEKYALVESFDDLTPINPNESFHLETRPEMLTTRVMDMLTPLGRGQRAL
ncbi:MAG: transcription termination factor Rho, partial [bacterium]|nr:transcription termination factor Rho [bacterium]